MKKRSERRKHCALPMQAGSVLHLCMKRIARFVQKLFGVKNFEIGSRDPGHAHLGIVLNSLRRRRPSSISVPILKRIAQFVQKLLRGPQIRKLGHVTPATPIWGRLWSLRREAPSSISVLNLKRVALFVQKLVDGSQNFEIESRDPGHAHLGGVLFSVRRRGAVLRLFTKFEVDCSIRSKVIKGSRN